ncbi:hypothetical protein ACFSBZ_04315 [Amnibacterium flavum]|uniref:Uncharacterized protein n=1 Tax=Amnibacterium flavum TaxID=2173173 RepID=A0A2V1HT95_9MICO|nr:hypothetical protein [Amnibacterium flavum]PVZ94892.1 hypothetical protein DDQ50_11155 [Amnibacterium flavum]
MPDLGLLFDVDGPLASPDSRTVAVPSILTDLVTLARGGVPIAFITGRSDVFIRSQVVEPLFATGLADALRQGGAGMFAVFEKGGAWAEITPEGMPEATVDESVAFPDDVVRGIEALVADGFADTMFFDDTKRAMISIEARTDVDRAAYHAAQGPFEAAAFDLIAGRGLGIRMGDELRPDADGAVSFRVEPTIISTDIESITLDKDRGAERALAYFASFGDLPTRWRTVGDSRSDYLMADHLHTEGYDVAHVDVRPSDGVLERPYPIVTVGDLIHDEAGAAFLAHWVEELGLAR